MDAIQQTTIETGPDAADGFLADVVDGLARAQKTLPCKYFYDETGSRLFDTICGLDEYYPTRTETGLLESHGGEMASMMGRGVSLIEFGCGSLVKTRLLLDALDGPAVFVPIDISEEHLLRSAEALDADYPALEVVPVVADFTQSIALPDAVGRGDHLIGFFPGSTIGNFDHRAAGDFLATVAGMLGGSGALLIGVDLKKDTETLIRAYDDAEGVTAAFNLNIIERINRELDGDFETDSFRHEARYDAGEGRIEMHLVSEKAQTVTVGDHTFDFEAGESIHTENSYKYAVDEFQALAAGQGFSPARAWVDDDGLFSVHYLTVD